MTELPQAQQDPRTPDSTEQRLHRRMSSDSDEQQVIENASIEGTRAVFGDDLCHAVRKVNIGGQLRAAVTTVLPKSGGPVDCLMSLDIYEEEVGRLALALFKTDVVWMRDVLHVILPDGFTMILSGQDAEFTLRGAADEAVERVLGSEVLEAVNDSRVRKRELDEGKHLTQCVSIILAGSGAIINISLDLESGVRIQNQLYA